MPDRDTDLIEKLIGQRLADIATELKHLNDILEGFKSAAQREAQAVEAQLSQVQSMRNAIPHSIRYMGGRWPLRDGDGFATVMAQPTLAISSTEPDADSSTGDLRSTDER